VNAFQLVLDNIRIHCYSCGNLTGADMTLKVTVQEMPDHGGDYPVYYALDGGVEVLPCGALQLTSMVHPDDKKPVEFRIYAPGTWREANVIWHDEGDIE
jgi:hypothetical protein